MSESLVLPEQLDYSYLLYIHLICADGQIHIGESRFLDNLAEELELGDLTKKEQAKIISQDDEMIKFNEILSKIPNEAYEPCLETLAVLTYADGYCDPLERKMLEDIAKYWDYSIKDLNSFCSKGEEIFLSKLNNIEGLLDYKQNYSFSENIIAKVDSMSSGKLLKALKKTNLGRVLTDKIKKINQKIILDGPEFDKAINRCKVIAEEDLEFTVPALESTSGELNTLKLSLEKSLAIIEKKSIRTEASTANEALNFLKETESHFENEIFQKLEIVKRALNKKKRAMKYFTISFIGKTKAGKSTLHSVITREGEDAIGVGKQRTTRLNRVYEWKNIRIIDTPGIGAPGGKTDEEIASSIIDESDIICFILTNNNQQETEFAFLKKLKEKAKPLIILLNVKGNLDHKRKLERFLDNYEKIFSVDDKNALGGHYDHIINYAEKYYGNAYFDIIPVQLYAALLSGKDDYIEFKDKLFEASHLQKFLDSIKISLIEDGTIRRSQTLLGSTVGDIQPSFEWCVNKYHESETFIKKISNFQKESQVKIKKVSNNSKNQLEQKIKKIFVDLRTSVQKFAESNWDRKKRDLNDAWQNHVDNLKVDKRLSKAYEEIISSYSVEIKEILEEIGNEISLMTDFSKSDLNINEQDSSTSMKTFLKLGGGVLGIIGSVALIILGTTNPVGWTLIAVGIVSNIVSSVFSSKVKKQQKAVNNIISSLKKQIDSQEIEVRKSLLVSFKKNTETISNNIQLYFSTLIEGFQGLSNDLQSSATNLEKIIDELNCAYAKRVTDWLVDSPEAFSKESISNTIISVERTMGRELTIYTNSRIDHKKSQDRVRSVLQEKLIIIPKEKLDARIK